MFNDYQIDEYIEDYNTHEEYHLLMNEFSSTEIYNEALHFLGLAFPKWNTNEGLGSHSAEFLHTVLKDVSYMQDRNEFTFLEMLTDLYLELVDNYQTFKQHHDFTYFENMMNDFEEECDEILTEYEDTYTTQEAFSYHYDALLGDFKLKHLRRNDYYF